MEIIKMKLCELKPYEKNAKLHPQKQVEQIKESIRKFGMNDPIGIWGEKNIIVEGHGRYQALKELGVNEVDCIRLDHLTDIERKEYTLIHNKTTMNSDFDLSVLDDELSDIMSEDLDIDMDFFDFDVNVENTEIVEDDFEVELPEKPNAKIGDVYQLGNHRLMCGSSIDENDIIILLNGKNPDLIYTDPPYGMNAVSNSGVLSAKYDADIMNDDNNEVAISSFNLAKKYFEKAKHIWWGANYYTECLPSSECWIVWDKNNGGSDQTDCELAWTNLRSVVRQFTMASEKINRVHPTQKPCKLFQEIIKKFEKKDKYNNILDLFGGSGSTLIACEQMNRNCYMMELDPKYVDVIIKRWEQFTGNKAVLLNEGK